MSDVQQLADLLTGFEGEPLVDPTRNEVSDHLELLPDSMSGGGSLVLLWSGHGRPLVGDLRLITTDSPDHLGAGISAVEVVRQAALSGAGQLLFIFDTCFSGTAVASAASVAVTLLQAVPSENEQVWVGVLASCSPTQTAIDGVFGHRLRALLRDGPSDPDQRRRWSAHNKEIYGEDLWNALVKEWGEGDQKPGFHRSGTAERMLPNPLHDPGAPAQVVEHLLLAARGGPSADHRSWFTGRTDEVNQVVSWVASRERGMRVVTGSAGTGKSAIVGRVVSLSDPAERERLGGGLEHDDPGLGSVAANVHARGLTTDQVAERLDGQLVGGKLLTAAETGRRNAAELVGALQRALAAGADPPVVAIDGLDEARGESFTIAEDLLVRLAEHATVIVSTRDLPRDAASPTLIEALGLIEALRPVEVLDLDAPDVLISGRRALHGYVAARLATVDPRMYPVAVAGYLSDTWSGSGDRPFLLARLVTDQLRAVPVDTSVRDWQQLVSHSTEQAFDLDLARIEGTTAADLVRALLTALTWGYGAGLPEEEWLVVAGVLAGSAVTREDVSWVLDELGRYVVQDGEAGVAVYRLAHQSLADHLRPAFRPSQQQPFDPAALLMARALLDRYRALIERGLRPEAPAYLWRYAWRHAAIAGPAGLDSLRDLARTAPALTFDVALAALDVASTFAHWGRRADAVAPTEEAVTLRRAQAADNPAHQPDLAIALNSLGNRYHEVGRHTDAVAPTEEAVILRWAQAADNPSYQPDLAGALSNLGIHYSKVGRRADAVAPTAEAVTLYRDLAADNPAHQPNLAMALTNLGNRYSEVGRRADAVAATEEAVTLRRAQAADNPSYQPDLAMALNNLGNRYHEVGRRTDAVAPTEEAVTLRRAQAADNPSYQPDLAMALNNLGIRYREVGRWTDAVGPTAEAATLYRDLAADNRAYQPNLAAALTNLGACYSKLDRRADGVNLTEEAVTLYRDLVADNRAHQPDLAMALTNLGACYSAVDRRAEAVGPTEEAVTLYRDLAADNHTYQPNLAMALTNLGIHYSEVGRRTDALAPTEEAVTLYRDLAADNHTYQPNLAGTLTNLGNRYGEVGRHTDAVSPTEEAATLYRDLAADNPAHQPNLAMALTNLGVRYSGVGRHTDAVSPTEEAATLYRDLAADNHTYQPDLAVTLTNLGVRYSGVGRHTDAVNLTEEALTLYRDLAADNSAYQPDLAMALTNLGIGHSEVGRRTDALASTEEAVTRYRDLAADNPAYQPDLAMALNNLERHATDVGEPERAETQWQHAMDTVGPSGAAVLLLHRASAADAGSERAIPWLVKALQGAGKDRGLLAKLHDEARRHRAAGPARWDSHWQGHTGAPAPRWLIVDHELLATARQWIDTPTFDAERDFLAEHTELLGPAADTAVAEALIDVDEPDRYEQLRADAQVDGVEIAYRPVLLASLAWQFGQADPTTRRELLSTRRDDLLTDEVADALNDRSIKAQRALALLSLADADRATALDATLTALDQSDRFPALLHDTATSPSAADTLAAVAGAAVSVAETNRAAACALFYLAVAVALSGDAVDAVATLGEARDTDPDLQTEWITELSVIGATHPAVLQLIPHLLEAQS